MRTTIDIPNMLHSELKRMAAREGSTMREIINRALNSYLRSNGKQAAKIRSPIIPSKTPGKLKLNNRKIYDLIDFP